MCEEKTLRTMVEKVIRENPEILHKSCRTCSRTFPAHEWFFTKHPNGVLGFEARCKECISISKGRSYKIISAIELPWYEGKEQEFQKMFRIMTENELSEYFNVTKQEISYATKKLKLRMRDIIDNLVDEEIIYMLNSLIEGKRKCFPNGIYKHTKYKIIIFKHLIDNVLKWNRKDICNKINYELIDKYKLAGMFVNAHLSLYEIINISYPSYNIKKWELRNSSMGSWSNKDIKDVLKWIKDKMLERGITSIYKATTIGF